MATSCHRICSGQRSGNSAISVLHFGWTTFVMYLKRTFDFTKNLGCGWRTATCPLVLLLQKTYKEQINLFHIIHFGRVARKALQVRSVTDPKSVFFNQWSTDLED